MSFTPKTPYLTVDGIIELYDESNTFQGIVLIERKYPPLGLALPGGFVDVGERVEDALRREMLEETTLEVSELRLLGVYSDPSRDKRFHTVSCVYICKAHGTPKGCDDAKKATLYPLAEIPLEQLVFDHRTIVEDYLRFRGGM